LPGQRDEDTEPTGLNPVSWVTRGVKYWNKMMKRSKTVVLTCTPSAPIRTSPCTRSPFSRMAVADKGSASMTRLHVLRTTGTPSPSGAVARRLSSSCRCTRWTKCQGCCQILFGSAKSTSRSSSFSALYSVTCVMNDRCQPLALFLIVQY